MISGDVARGDHNPTDFIYRYMRSVVQLGVYLNEPAPMDMTPVCFVAAAMNVIVCNSRDSIGRTFHLTNCTRSLTFDNVGKALALAVGETSVPVPVSYAVFCQRLVEAMDTGKPVALTALATHFALGSAFGFGGQTWQSVETDAFLAAHGVAAPTVDEKLIQLYLKTQVWES
jgi:hypothetical protein